MALSDQDRYRATRKVTFVAIAVNSTLAIVQILLGLIGQSQALVADGVHTLSDLGSDFVVLFAARLAREEADEEHPYGHGRVETAATVALALVLILVAFKIGIDAGTRLFDPDTLLTPSALTLAGAVLAIAFKEGLYHYTARVAKRIRSKMLQANAWHHRSDVVSSLIVLVGIGGTLAGLPYLDAVAAVLVAVMIAHMGWKLGWQSVRELIDTGLETEQVQAIRDAIADVDGVRSLHMLRTRRMGSEAIADVHVLVDPRISVSEGHRIGESVERTLVARFDELAEVTVHIDPEDDERVRPSSDLPLRAELVDRLRQRWAGTPEADRIENLRLHYLDGRVHLEITLPLDAADGDGPRAALTERMVQATRGEPEIGEVVVLYH
jgi:cation diffusion facilitator family transporter